MNKDAATYPTLLPPDASWKQIGESAPPSGRLVLYRTPYYQMMGYMNHLGRWIASDGKQEKMPVRWWREVGGDFCAG